MKLVARLFSLIFVLMIFITAPMSGCSGNPQAVEAAYQRGLDDGIATVKDQLVAAESAYDQGYADGLAAAEPKQNKELCERCYDLGFSEGYEAASAAR